MDINKEQKSNAKKSFYSKDDEQFLLNESEKVIEEKINSLFSAKEDQTDFIRLIIKVKQIYATFNIIIYTALVIIMVLTVLKCNVLGFNIPSTLLIILSGHLCTKCFIELTT